MTDQTSAPSTSKQAYNLTLTPLGEIDTTPTLSGTKKMKFRASYVTKGKTVERTVVAQGKAADKIDGIVKTGEPVALRCIFDRAPANDDGKPGGEFLTVVAIPLPPKAKAA